MESPKVDTFAIKNFVANFIIPIVSLGLVIVLFIFVVYPSINRLPVLQKDLAQKEELGNLLETKYRKLTTLIDFQASVEENRTLVSDVLPEESLVPQLLTQIDQIARESGLEVEKLSYAIAGSEEVVEGGTHKLISISLGTKGSYDRVITFFSSLENAGRVVDVNTFRYSITDEGLIGITFVLRSPYVELDTKAVTDDPITFDLNDKGFQDLMSRLRDLKIYRISVEQVINIDELEATPEEVEGEGEEEVPVLEGESVPTEVVEELVESEEPLPEGVPQF